MKVYTMYRSHKNPTRVANPWVTYKPIKISCWSPSFGFRSRMAWLEVHQVLLEVDEHCLPFVGLAIVCGSTHTSILPMRMTRASSRNIGKLYDLLSTNTHTHTATFCLCPVNCEHFVQ